MDAKIFRINYKSDFILTLNSDAGWMTPFCIKFWTGAPSQAFYAQWDGETYTHCAYDPSEPTKLTVQFDDHHLPIGELKYQVAYHFTVDDFPNDTEDEVLNPGAITTEIDGEEYQVMLDFTGETAPEIQFSLPAYANEAQRIENEQQRIAAEEARIQNEETRIAQEEARVTEFAQLKRESEAATADANAAADLANEKAQLAAGKAALANEKAALAQQKAEYAQAQGNYAKEQGDYAKEQGDTALADHQRAEADHGIAVDDHTQAGNDHTRAEADHGIAADDHIQAGNDHTRAESDHAAVEVYVDSLGAFDISAYHATGGVLAKYADLTAALDSNNGGGVPQSLQKGGMSVKFVQSSDNKYVQYRYMGTKITGTPNPFLDTANWQGVDDVPTAGSNNLINSNAAFELGCSLNIFGSSCFLKTGFISSEGIIYFRDNNDYLVLIAKINPAKSYMYYHANGSGGSKFATFFDSNFVKTGNRFNVSVENWVELTPQDIPANSEYFAMNVRYNGEDIANVIQASIVEKSSFVERLLEPVTSEKLVNGSVTTEKVADKSITSEKLDSSIWNKLLVVQRTENLFNELTIVDNELINNAGGISKSDGWARTPLIPIEGGESYYISAEEWTRGRGFSWFDADKNLIAEGSGDVVIAGLKVAPSNAAYMAFNMASTGLDYSKKVMVAKSSLPIPYDYYNKIEMGQVKGLIELLPEKPALTLTKNGNDISITNDTYTINSKLERNYDNIYGTNPVFNLENEDEIAPVHMLNTTIGANHGQPCVRAFIQNHGLDNTSIGTGWQKDGITYYVMRIDDSNNITFLSENQGTLESPSFIALTVGDITNNGETLTVSSVTSAQLYPALKNHSVRIVDSRGNEINDDGIYYSDSFDIIESYEIMNPASTLQKIIARAGQSTEPIYDGDSAIMVENTYRFTRSMTVLVIVNVLPLQNVAFNDIMFSQAMRKGDNGVVKYYVPNSLPLGNYDMRTPLTMTWNKNVTIPKIGTNQMKDPENNPVNRVIQYDTANSMGFALGFLTDYGVGEHLLDYTNYTFELRNNTGKVYPHGVDKKIGTTLTAGTIYTAIMYRSRFVPETVGHRMSMYHFDFNGIEYVYIDYSGSMLDKVIVDDKLNGKKISVLESVNTELKTDIYNGGFYINATYIQNDTCYMICKIE